MEVVVASKKIVFRVKDVLQDEEVTPGHVSASLLEEFTSQVATFLRGSKRINLKEVIVSIKTGSLVLEVDNQLDQLDEAFADYSSIRAGHMDGVDPVRQSVVLEWQEAARKNEARIYELFSDNDEPLRISTETNFARPQSSWVEVEKYIYGQVYDMGGKSRANVHLQLENGNTIKVGSDAKLLLGDSKNRLYKDQLVRIKAKQNLESGELREEKLIGFEEYAPHYDEEEFSALVRKGTVAWGSVENGSDWVEALRGNV